MKIAHEAPLSIFDQVQELTDYDYALVHLFEESEEYFNKFKEARDKGREIILDNSIFELGEAFDDAKFAYWIGRLRPAYYIIPDALEDSSRTIRKYNDFVSKFEYLPGKSIGVAQGKTYEEFLDCYNYLVDKVDKIAISFDYCFFNDWFPDEPTKYHSYMKGRQELIVRMLENGEIVDSKPHHLLGCGLPQEFELYQNMSFIDSVDTSNPVVHGIMDIRYEPEGLENKESVKLFTLIEEDVLERLDVIKYNIKKFREFCNG